MVTLKVKLVYAFCGLLLLTPVGFSSENTFPFTPVFLLLNTDACDEKPLCQSIEICSESTADALDNNCNGQVDENCACLPGSVQSCFKGDPSYRFADGCYAGTQACSTSGRWGQCEGGAHATDACYDDQANACRAINGSPFAPVDLKAGTDNFSNDALTERWDVNCPDDVHPCPLPTGQTFQALVSGEYRVDYHKSTAAGSDSCTYPLFIGAPGLRVELSWEWPEDQPDTVDLDLHLHKPGDTDPWGGDQGSDVDCAWDNCTAFDCEAGRCPTWFAGVKPPDPLNWYLDPVAENNTCYYSPDGSTWQFNSQGCHNPRLDTDNISCAPNITDPQSSNYCHTENINIDFPPLRQWTRIGVHYYANHGQNYDVHPQLQIFCDGRLAARLGSQGFYLPQAPVTFTPTDSDTLMWLAADVAFLTDSCGDRRCVVAPVYANSKDRTPVLSTVTEVQALFAPPYPALP